MSAFLPPACADETADTAAAAENGRVVVMQRYIVSATRVGKTPWRYTSVRGLEVLSRAPDEETHWWLDALRRGLMLEDQVLPKEWLPRAPVPYTVIIDDTDLAVAPAGQIQTTPIKFQPPVDALTWGRLSSRPKTWNDHFEAHDQDTYAVNTNVYGADISTAACVIGLERVFRCAPPLPRWLIVGLLGRNCGVFRESFMPDLGFDPGELIRSAYGPGTLWVSLDRTREILKMLKKNKKTKIEIPPLGSLFSEDPPSGEARLLWESEAALFVRWGLMGPGREDTATSQAFLEFVSRSRNEPVTERMFTECFGFGYAAMQERLASLLEVVLAEPTSVDLEMPSRFDEPDLREATADQIGRILGDWLRMEGDSIRVRDPSTGRDFLDAAGRMLERAYREDNGLPPNAEPIRMVERSAKPAPNTAFGSAVVMKPFVVTADRIHDPGLLAVYGLYEHDVGSDEKARELLEAAVKTGAVRPGACLVLGEMRYQEAVAKPGGSGGKLSTRQTASILEPLRIAMRYPPVPGAYGVAVETWSRSEAKPGDDDIDTLDEGVARYPRVTALTYRTALLCAQSGRNRQAAELIDKGLLFATREDSRRHLEQLRATLALPAAPGGK